MNFGDVSVIAVDWSGLAGCGYVSLTSALGIKEPAGYIVELVKLIMQACGIAGKSVEKFFEKITIAGHSLGAHIAGWVGYLLRHLFHYLIGLALGKYNSKVKKIDNFDR